MDDYPGYLANGIHNQLEWFFWHGHHCTYRVLAVRSCATRRQATENHPERNRARLQAVHQPCGHQGVLNNSQYPSQSQSPQAFLGHIWCAETDVVLLDIYVLPRNILGDCQIQP